MKPYEKPEIKPEMNKKCNCGPECGCGCNEGKECRCEEGCKCGCHNGCKCGKSCGGKILVLLLIFLAGMGFNELLHGCFGRCKCPCMRHAATMPAPHRQMADGDNAGTVVIVNAGGGAEVYHGMKHNMNHGNKHHHDKMKKHQKNYQDEPAQPQTSAEIEGRTIKIK